jgi:hypothetical protein
MRFHELDKPVVAQLQRRWQDSRRDDLRDGYCSILIERAESSLKEWGRSTLTNRPFLSPFTPVLGALSEASGSRLGRSPTAKRRALRPAPVSA